MDELSLLASLFDGKASLDSVASLLPEGLKPVSGVVKGFCEGIASRFDKVFDGGFNIKEIFSNGVSSVEKFTNLSTSIGDNVTFLSEQVTAFENGQLDVANFAGHLKQYQEAGWVVPPEGFKEVANEK